MDPVMTLAENVWRPLLQSRTSPRGRSDGAPVAALMHHKRLSRGHGSRRERIRPRPRRTDAQEHCPPVAWRRQRSPMDIVGGSSRWPIQTLTA
jgi:hypothetical protein